MNTAGELLGQFGQKVRGFYRITADGVVETSQQLRGLDQADRAAALKLLAGPYGQPRIPESQFALPQGGFNRKFILPYDGAGVSGRTIFKPESGIDPAQRDWLSGEPGYVREINAYETSEKFKLGLVPRTWKAVHDHGDGVLRLRPFSHGLLGLEFRC